MSSSEPTFITSVPTNNSEFTEAYCLLLRLYSSLLNNAFIQTSIKQLAKISQPLVNKLDISIISIRNNYKKWMNDETIFTSLANLWLSANLPFDGSIISYEDFRKQINRKLKQDHQQAEELPIKNFYDFACETWNSFDEPESDDIKNAILAIVARSINKTHRIEGEALATALYNMLRMLVEKQRELVSAKCFYNLVKTSLGTEFFERNQKMIYKACGEYYSFAKKFLLIDYPLATNDRSVLNVTLEFIKKNLFASGFAPLKFIERQLDILLRLFDQKPQECLDQSLSGRTQVILKKAFLLSVCPFKKLNTRLHYPNDTKIFSNIDKYLHISNRIDDAIGLTALGYRMLWENVLEPAFSHIKIFKDEINAGMTVVMHGLDNPTIRKNFTKLRSQFRMLRKCIMMLEEDTLKLIFNDKLQFELDRHLKRDLLRFYNEVKTMEKEKIIRISVEYYSQILKKVKRTYNRARKVEYYGYSEIRSARPVKRLESASEGFISRYESEASTENSVISTMVEIAS